VEVRLTHPAAAFAAITALAPMADEAPLAEGDVVRVTARDREAAIMDAVRLLDRAGVGAKDVVVRRPTLDDVFLTLTGHEAEPQDEQVAA